LIAPFGQIYGEEQASLEKNIAQKKINILKKNWQILMNSKQSLTKNDEIWEKEVVVYLMGVHKALNQAKSDLEETGVPTLNVAVDGMPMAGMNPDDIKDLEVRKKYLKAIEENKTAAANARWYIQLKRLLQKMKYDVGLILEKKNELDVAAPDLEKTYKIIEGELSEINN